MPDCRCMRSCKHGVLLDMTQHGQQQNTRLHHSRRSRTGFHHCRYDRSSPHALVRVCFAAPAFAVARSSCLLTAPFVRFIALDDGLLCLRALWAVLVTACGFAEHTTHDREQGWHSKTLIGHSDCALSGLCGSLLPLSRQPSRHDSKEACNSETG